LKLSFQVIVHLRDKTTAKAQLLYYQKHYNLALFRVKVDQPVQLPSFNDKVQWGQHIFQLGREKYMSLTIHQGRVEYSDPHLIEKYHCLSITGGQVDFKVHLFCGIALVFYIILM
jgi:small nuclear ribonucleoprotein (snRNP)-like protein